MSDSRSNDFKIIRSTPEEAEQFLADFGLSNYYGKGIYFNENLSQFHYVGKINNNIYIKNLNANEYLDLRTGEIKESNHIENRSQNINSLRQSMKRIRDKINCNIYPANKSQWLFITLTYADNMQDTKKLYNDFKNFLRRFKEIFPTYDGYIYVPEPQGRGAWHIHCLMKFKTDAPYIPNLQDIWQHGFVKIVSLKNKNIDNIGAYFSAYLGDMEYSPDNLIESHLNGYNDIEIIEKEVEVEPGQFEKKKFLKGARLFMYPPKMNLIRCSKNMKNPIIKEMTYQQYEKKVGCSIPTFSTFSNVYLNGSYSHFIGYIEYNKEKSKNQVYN